MQNTSVTADSRGGARAPRGISLLLYGRLAKSPA